MRRVVALVMMLAAGVGTIHAADQTILGSGLWVKDPKRGIDPGKRRIVGQGKEKASSNTIDGDPTLLGATVTVFESGASSTSQAFVLPPGVDPATGSPFWKATPTGFG